jgi:hypothetical protein
MRKIEKPEVEVSGREERQKHPAFGTIIVTNPQGHIGRLFGSDLGHSSSVSITISGAELYRNLGRDWIYPRGPIVEVEMSHAQWAEFVSSSGRGGGTPCTIRYAPAPGFKMADVPGIEQIETKHDLHRREIRESSEKAVENLNSTVKRFREELAKGRPTLTVLREISHSLDVAARNLPANLEYAVKSAEEALDKATSDAKIEVESYISVTAQRLGLEQISDLKSLTHKKQKETPEDSEES